MCIKTGNLILQFICFENIKKDVDKGGGMIYHKKRRYERFDNMR